MEITGHVVEQVKDPFGILEGERYEVMLAVEVPEDDELHQEAGLKIRVIYRVSEGSSGIVQYELLEAASEKYINFELEAEELALVAAYCDEHCRTV
ncbi:DUF6509 family protein [Paenibacillus sp. 1P07SE]|uniref:DUF6509 family protein n=1 Tax=Paenibacillus sp. 1P07SE TaxID=3132209 RepID=UPI0039A70733